MKFLVGCLGGIVIIVVILVLAAGYFGFVPGLSNIFGSNKPVNLGTTYTQQDYVSGMAKSGVQFLSNADQVSADSTQKSYGPAKAVSADFTPAEVLAILNEKVHAPDFPVKDWQIRVNADGTVEVAAVILLDNVSGYATSHGVTSETVQQVLDTVKKFGVVQKEIPFYAKGTAKVTNGQLSFEVSSIKIGRLPISTSMVNDHKSDILDFFNTHKNDVPGLQINNAGLVNGKLHFDGTLPSTIKLK